MFHVACRIVKVVILVNRRLAARQRFWTSQNDGTSISQDDILGRHSGKRSASRIIYNQRILDPVPFDTGLEQARMTI